MEFTSRDAAEQKHRLIVLTDMENEPDDSQTMVKLLMYSNEIDIEGLVAVTSRWLREETFPSSIVDRIHAYGIVRPNLMRHATGWPDADLLLSRTGGGQRGFGMQAVGDGEASRGSRLIVEAVDRDDPRPVWVAINAGANTLAQALWDVRRERSQADVERFISRLRVYDDSGQDDAGAWICHTFPDIFYIRSRSQVFGLFGPSFGLGPQPWKPLNQFDWLETHVRTRHGILGALCPQRIWVSPPWNSSSPGGTPEGELRIAKAFMDGGGTTTWLGLANKGLFEPEEISWGGWGGRFSRTKEQVPAGQYQVDELEKPYEPFLMYPQAQDTSVGYPDPDEPVFAFSGVQGGVPYYPKDFAPLWRWRGDYTRDFQGRMDWCVAEPDEANHHPVADLMGDRNRAVARITAAPGETLRLDASGSTDPGGRELRFEWSLYPEAGTCPLPVPIDGADAPAASVSIPADASGLQIHVILRVTNAHPEVPLTSYRRVVIDVAD
jgi:hypothetical protein